MTEKYKKVMSFLIFCQTWHLTDGTAELLWIAQFSLVLPDTRITLDLCRRGQCKEFGVKVQFSAGGTGGKSSWSYMSMADLYVSDQWRIPAGSFCSSSSSDVYTGLHYSGYCSGLSSDEVGLRSPQRVDEKPGSSFINRLWKLSRWGASTEAEPSCLMETVIIWRWLYLALLSGWLSNRKSWMRGHSETILFRETLTAC